MLGLWHNQNQRTQNPRSHAFSLLSVNGRVHRHTSTSSVVLTLSVHRHCMPSSICPESHERWCIVSCGPDGDGIQTPGPPRHRCWSWWTTRMPTNCWLATTGYSPTFRQRMWQDDKDGRPRCLAWHCVGAGRPTGCVQPAAEAGPSDAYTYT